MNAIDLLEQQHREVEDLFEEYEDAGENARKTKERICQRLADALAVHAGIEEQLFYPAAKSKETEDILRESVEEHLAAKRVIADLLGSAPDDVQFDARVKVLQEQIEHHVEEEEEELFPKVRKALSAEELDELGEQMEQLAEELEAAGSPRDRIPGETDQPSKI